MLFGYAKNLCAQQIDSLKAEYAKAATIEKKTDIAYEIGYTAFYSESKTSLAYAKMGAVLLGNKIVPNTVNLNNIVGIHYSLNGKYDSAHYYYNIALKAAERLGDDKLLIKVKGNLGDLYSYMGQYPKALELQMQMLHYYQKNNIQNEIVISNINIGNTYNYMEDAKKSLAYYQKAYPVLKNQKTKLAANLFNSMASVLQDIKKYDEALVMFNKSLAIKKQLADSMGICNTLINITSLYNDKGNAAEARKYALKALAMARQLGNQKLQALVQSDLGTLDKGERKFAEALQKHFENLGNAKKVNDIYVQRSELARIYAIYEQQGNYQLAFSYLQQYQQLLDTVDGEAAAKQIAESETKYKTLEKELENQKLQAVNKLQVKETEKTKQKMYFIFWAAVLILLSGMAVFYLLYRYNNIKIQNKQREIATKAVFEGEQNERIRIARDLHDGIGQMLSVVKMNLSTISPADKNVEGAANLVDKTIAEVRTISHNLIPEALNFGLFAALEDICQKIAESGKTKINLHVADELKQQTFSRQNELSIYRIVQEVLNNMLKHAGASHISIDITKPNANMLIAIKDNGKGFDTEKINESKGIGWKNISARVHLLDGKMNIHSERLMGTTIEISIPDRGERSS